MPWLEPVLAGAAVFIADQAGKHFVLARPGYAAATAPRSFLAIRCIVNKRGAARSPGLRFLPSAAFMLCVVFGVFALTQEPLRHSALGATGIGLALGGIVSNFVDLTRRRGIVDFIAIGPLPVCNIADLAIVGGLALAGLALAVWTLV
jgi:lipoprotein signal peptidase